MVTEEEWNESEKILEDLGPLLDRSRELRIARFLTSTVEVPLTYGDKVIGTAKVRSDGQIEAKISEEIGDQMVGLFQFGVTNHLAIAPIHEHPNKPALDYPDTRPIYRKKKSSVPTKDQSAYIFMDKTRHLVRTYIEARLDKSDPPVEFEVYIVWFSKTLQNWKALVSSTLPDGMYYEVTYNGDEAETYLDAYKKVENVKVVDTLEQTGFEILEFDQTGKSPAIQEQEVKAKDPLARAIQDGTARLGPKD